MRLRNNPKANDILASEPSIVIETPEDHKNKWHLEFGNDHPIYIEIGMGKGNFIIENAKRYPDINFIGIEKYPSVLVVALSKVLEEEKLPNLRLMKYDALALGDVFGKQEITQIFLNFSDPWPKSRHEKRRLTYKSFLDVYNTILIDKGSIVFKTDNRSLFEYSLYSMNNYGMQFQDVCLDLHNSEGYEDNILTEYERKFSPFGPIYRIDTKFKGVE